METMQPDRAQVTGDRRAEGSLVPLAVVAGAVPVVLGVLFHVAFGYLDRPEPDRGPASAAFAAVVALWLASLPAIRHLSGARGWAPVLGGVGAGGIAAVPLVVTVQGSYASMGLLRPAYPGVAVASVVVSALVGVGVLVVMWRMSGQRPLGGVAVLGSGLSATYGFAGLWLLVTIGEQVAKAAAVVGPRL